eukprot:scaffold8_cov249-Pinguiococcus_pyrenoidosus.AAC.9
MPGVFVSSMKKSPRGAFFRFRSFCSSLACPEDLRAFSRCLGRPAAPSRARSLAGGAEELPLMVRDRCGSVELGAGTSAP